jgi:hypothetical protein
LLFEGKNIISLDLMNMQRLVLPSKQRCHFNNAIVIVIGKKERKKKTRRKVKEQKK